MKIALICTEKLPVPPVAGGAVQLYIDGIVPYLSKQHDITVYSIQYPGLPDEETKDHVKHIRVPGKTDTIYVNNIKTRLDNTYDLIHVFNRPRFLLSFMEKFPAAKFSLSLHNEMFHTDKISDAAAIECIEKAEFINTVSRFIANTVKQRFPIAEKKLHVVYSGVDLQKYKPSWTTEGEQNKLDLKKKFGLQDYKVVLYVGRLSVKKGVHVILKAMEKVMSTHQNVALVIVGSKWYGKNESDDYTKSLQTLSQSLAGPIVFTGFVPPSGVPEYFSMGDVFVCASQWNEPLARVHYEAMAAGLPIITTNRGGNAEVVDGYGNGIVIDDYKDSDVMAGHISHLLDNPEQAFEMGMKGRKLAEEKFNWERVAAEVFHSYAPEVSQSDTPETFQAYTPEVSQSDAPEASQSDVLEKFNWLGFEGSGKNVSIIGTGYVGLVTGACLASMGMNVLCCDTDENKIADLKKGILPIYEPCLGSLVDNCVKHLKRLDFTSDVKRTVTHSDVIFITVNTPTMEDNSCDLRHVFDAARKIARHMTCYKVVVNKSTVPVGTGRKVKKEMERVLEEQKKQLGFDVVSNPEFLKEGSAVYDFINPERIVIGAESKRAVNIIKAVYGEQVQYNIPVLVTGIETAEMIKYASNAFLATKISFINETANICELCGADIAMVARGMGLDSRIGSQFLNPGPGFGGSCFPKDVRALAGIIREYGYIPYILNSVLEVNSRQKERMIQKIENALGRLEYQRIAILGIAFKPETDDIRESPSCAIILALLGRKAIVSVYDPQAMQNMKKEYPEMNVKYCNDVYSACAHSDCIVLVTDWKEFSGLDFKKLKSIVNKPNFLDLRNVYEPDYVKGFGFHYEGVGRK